MKIIFDFNRTIFDPDRGLLIPGAKDILQYYFDKKYSLYLISRLEPGRERMVDQLGIEAFFKEMHFVINKKEPMQRIISDGGEEVYVVGDYLFDEIRWGNTLGAKTIWVQAGCFALEEPEIDADIPLHTIMHLSELKKIIL